MANSKVITVEVERILAFTMDSTEGKKDVPFVMWVTSKPDHNAPIGTRENTPFDFMAHIVRKYVVVDDMVS